MKELSFSLPLDVHKHISDQRDKFLGEILTDYLGRRPANEDFQKCALTVTIDNHSISKFYYDKKEVGTITTTVHLDNLITEASINLDFIPYVPE